MSETPQTLFRQAQHFEAEGDWPRAADLYEKVLEREPDFVGALHNLGQVYRHLHRLKDAIARRHGGNETGAGARHHPLVAGLVVGTVHPIGRGYFSV